MPRLSIITINFNQAEGLEKTLLSVQGQSFKDFQYIVIDGGSTDASVEKIKPFSFLISYWVSEQDRGIYHAMNKGITQATGDYLLFLNSGDSLASPKALQEVFAHPLHADLVGGDLIQTKASGGTIKVSNPREITATHLYESTLLHPSTLIHRSLFERYGSYAEEFRIVGDYEFFVRVLLKYEASYQHLPVTISLFDSGGVSSNPKHQLLHKEERKLVVERYFPALVRQDLETLFRLQHGQAYLFYQWTQKYMVLRLPCKALLSLYARFSRHPFRD